jgi:EAL domain-containing protein (putative c-di-GMP-specific phosphodiesterase class I)
MDSVIVEAIHRIGRVAGIQTIAEFVESDAIRQRLVEIGVDYAQGYGIHRPEPLATQSATAASVKKHG